ncbi:MAG: hypothetical protein K5780_03035 [Alphaproteobacteria bacterium]|nr:hypothetical protein [Alphaproteobacteria bacterium]
MDRISISVAELTNLIRKTINFSGRINKFKRSKFREFPNEEILFRKAKRTFARMEQILKIRNFLSAPFAPSVAPVLSLRTAALFFDFLGNTLVPLRSCGTKMVIFERACF